MWTTDDTLRAADTDRDATATILRSGHAEGRLTPAEFDERLEHCFSAKTMGELRTLVADLPGEHQHPMARMGRMGWNGRPSSFRRFRPSRLLPFILLGLFFVIPALIGGHAAWHRGPFDGGHGPYAGHHAHWFPWLLVILSFITIGALMRRLRYSPYGRW